jgi:hypothetical protein
MAPRTKRVNPPPATIIPPIDLKAGPDGCEEASLHSAERYIPCNAPARHIVGWRGRSDAPIRMCDMCADHNVKNRGGYVVNTYTSKNPPATQPLPLGNNVTDNDLIAESHKLADQVKAGAAKFAEWKKPLDARSKEIEDQLFARLVERGADSTKTDAGTAYISNLASVVIQDQATLFDFAADHWEKVGDEVKLSIGIKAVRAWMDEHDGQLPPGVSLSKYSRLNINRS